MRYHKDGSTPPDRTWVFVFGSNLAGRHGAGAAKEAYLNWGAIHGVGRGMAGCVNRFSYAIPTKDRNIQTRPLADIVPDINTFVLYTKNNSRMKFWVTRIGCVLAGFTDAEIAPLFKGLGENCSVAIEWKEYLE